MTEQEFTDIVKDGQNSIYMKYDCNVYNMTAENLIQLMKKISAEAVKSMPKPGENTYKVTKLLGEVIACANLVLRHL